MAAAGGASRWLTMTRDLAYLAAAILFILGLKRLSSPRTARAGNGLAALGMLLAILATVIGTNPAGLVWALAAMVVGGGVGAVMAVRVQMTQMPQMVAMLNGFGGIASALVAGAEWMNLAGMGAGTGVERPAAQLVMIGAAALIGCATFTGSLIAAGKLHGALSGKPVPIPNGVIVNVGLLALSAALIAAFTGAGGPWWALALLVLIALVLGVTLTIPIGGADMPVMVSLLNSYSGLAAAATGFIIFNKALIVSGALVGASGLILTAIMCKAMNRSLANVLFAGVGTADSTGAAGTTSAKGVVKSADADDVAIILDSARQVIIVPGYGMAVAQAQHAVRELMHALERKGVKTLFAVHPVAGRMPGHMNILLAEADIPYDRVLDLDQANQEFEQTDAVMVIGANDVVNPAARTDKSSPIYGMPILDVDKARTVFVLKRSMGAGYAGVDNDLFIAPGTLMVFGDAKKTVNAVVTALGEL